MGRDLLDHLSDVDPARDLDLPEAADRQGLRESILTQPRPSSAPTQRRWSPDAGLAAAASLLIMALAAGMLFVDLGAPAVIATPELRVPVDAPSEPANELLRELADAAVASGRQAAPGRQVVSWSLSTATSDGQSSSEILARASTWWLHDDGTATRCRAPSAAMDVQLARAQTTDDVAACDETERLGPDEHARTTALPGDTPQELIEAVTDHAQRPAHVEVADGYLEALRTRSVSGKAAAVWLRALAETGELVDYGEVTDRAGRDARAVGFTTESSGLPTRHLLLLAPTDGQVLAHEEALTTRAGALDVEIPSVTSYAAFFDVEEPAPR